MSFVLSLGEITGSEKVGEIYVRGDEYQKDGKKLLIKKVKFSIRIKIMKFLGVSLKKECL